MQAIIKSRVVATALILLACFVPLSLLMDNGVLYVVVGSILFTTSLAVLHAYWPSLKVAVSYSVKELSYADLLTMGIVLIFVSTSFREMYVTFYRIIYVSGLVREDEYFTTLSFFRYVGAIGAILVLEARRFRFRSSVFGRMPGWPYVVISVSAGIIIAIALLSIGMYYS